MKILSFLLLATALGCAAQVKAPSGKADDITFSFNQAIVDSARDAKIVPGLNRITGDTLFLIATISENRFGGPVLTKKQLCEYLKDEYEQTSQQQAQIDDERKFLDQRAEEVKARRSFLIDWYKKFKANYGIDCMKVVQ
jgi:hypothetical protein